MARGVLGVLFDKDGTLIDFRDTWDGFAADLIAELSEGDAGRAARLADAMDFDLATGGFRPTSPIIAGTSWEAAECVARGLGGADVAEIEALMAQRASVARMAPVVPLGPFCTQLRDAGLRLGVATNDAEAVARANLDVMGVKGDFDYIAGFDSGYGGKPDPGMVLGFCQTQGLSPETCIMVGDSTHDLIAAQRAGVRGIGVLTGTSRAEDLAPFAEAVLPDIGHLPAWLGL